MKTTYLLATALLITASSAQAVDNNALKNTVILTGLITNSFAISQRDKFKPCETDWRFGYQEGSERDMHAQTLRLSPLTCELAASDVLPTGVSFKVMPTGLVSMWRANSGPYTRRNEEIALVPVGQFAWHLGAVILDASFGFGPSLIANTEFGYKSKSTHLQFSDEMGLGISDPKQRFRLDFTYRHISNADIKLPNNGMNFLGVGLTYRLN
jgi:hypothetical protein